MAKPLERSSRPAIQVQQYSQAFDQGTQHTDWLTGLAILDDIILTVEMLNVLGESHILLATENC